MKVMSILGLIASVIGLFFSYAITQIPDPENTEAPRQAGNIMLILFLFFLAFSITATVDSFTTKRPKQ